MIYSGTIHNLIVDWIGLRLGSEAKECQIRIYNDVSEGGGGKTLGKDSVNGSTHGRVLSKLPCCAKN
jgi:hypothetical protein